MRFRNDCYREMEQESEREIKVKAKAKYGFAGTDKGTGYDVVTAWMPKEQIEPYKEK